MTYSLRTTFIVITVVSILIVAFVTIDRNHKWYNHEVAELNLSVPRSMHGAQTIRVWTEGYIRETKFRKVLFQLCIDGQPYGKPGVAQMRSTGATDDVRILFADNNRYFCVHSPKNKHLLILGDSETHESVGAFTLKSSENPFARHSLLLSWREIFDMIIQQNPDADIEFPTPRDKDW